MTAGERWRAVRQRVNATRTGRLAMRVAIGVVGTIVVVGGLILVPLPGPGWLIVLVGLAIWSIEFAWARHLLEFTRERLRRWWLWLERRHWSIRVLVGLLTLAFVATVTLTSLAISLDASSPTELWQRLAPW